MEEIWKPISDFPGYEVSNLGQVRSYHQTKPKKEIPHILSSKCEGRYNRVTLCKNRICYSFTVHRLILESFIGKRASGQQCRHLDGNRINNKLSNLVWGTTKENAMDKIRHGTSNKGEKQNKHKLTDQEVLEIRELYAQEFPTKILAKQYNVQVNTICHVANGSIWKHVGGTITKRGNGHH